MDTTYFSAFAGLAGAVIGGFASLATNWLTQRAQLREQKLEKVRRQRESLFVEFLKEASRLYADALSHERDEIGDLAKLVAIAGHLRMVSSAGIVAAAERVIENDRRRLSRSQPHACRDAGLCRERRLRSAARLQPTLPRRAGRTSRLTHRHSRSRERALLEPGGMKTDFFSRSFERGRHPAYDEAADRVMTVITDPAQMATYSEAEQIAEVVYEAATDGKHRLRYVAGADAKGDICGPIATRR